MEQADLSQSTNDNIQKSQVVEGGNFTEKFQLQRLWMPQAIKTVKIASRNCLFLKVSGEILWPKGNRIEWVSSVWGFGVCFSPCFLTVEDENTRVWLRDPKGGEIAKFSWKSQSPALGLFLCSLEWSWLFWCVKTLQPTIRWDPEGKVFSKKENKNFRFA